MLNSEVLMLHLLIKLSVKPWSCSFSVEHVRWHFFHVCGWEMRMQQRFQEGQSCLWVWLIAGILLITNSCLCEAVWGFQAGKNWMSVELSITFLVLRSLWLYSMKCHGPFLKAWIWLHCMSEFAVVKQFWEWHCKSILKLLSSLSRAVLLKTLPSSLKLWGKVNT